MKPSAQVERVSGSRTTSPEVGNAGHRRFSITGALPPDTTRTKRATFGASAGRVVSPSFITRPMMKAAQSIALLLCSVISVGHSPQSHAYTCVSVNGLSNNIYVDGSSPPCAGLVVLTQADYDTARSPFASDPDWDVVQWAAGACVLMFAVGAGIGLIFSIVRKAK